MLKELSTVLLEKPLKEDQKIHAKGKYVADFDESDCITFKNLQRFRLFNLIIVNCPIWVVSIALNGVVYFWMYAT